MKNIKDLNVIRTERGWAGHFILAHDCEFRRNTLLEYKDIKIVVSSVGCWRHNGTIEQIGYKRYYETMAFYSDLNDKRYYDADVSKQINFDSEWSINEKDADDKANEMHETIVQKITTKLLAGETFPIED
jgi:hypothetical protein